MGGEVEEGVFEEGFLEEKNDFLPFTSPEGIVDPLATQKIEVRPEKFVRISRHIQGVTKAKYTALLTKYSDVFAWSHTDLKGIPPHLGQHRIDLMEGSVPVRQRQYRLNPKYSMLVKEEIDKLTEAGFIFPVLSSEWVSPIVIVPKKKGIDGVVKIRVCQDFRKLNAATRKDHYPLPFTDIVLDTVAGHSMFSFLDGYAGYNQISIREEDQLKTTFTTDWGTYAFRVMPFGLCNAPGTFQRVMMIIFQEFLHKFLEIFIDDFCVYSEDEDHLEKLEAVFQKCRSSGLCLHPDKCFMAMQQGVLLGHVISKAGIAVDQDKVGLIQGLLVPTNLGELRSFLGYVGYYRRFIKDYARLSTPLTELLKKEKEYVWTLARQQAFEALKRALVTAPVLKPPNWDVPFHVYIDASAFGVGSCLSQKDKNGKDHPIYFASRQMNAAEKNYTVTEREALAVIFSCKKFRHYLLGYKTVFHTDHSSLKYLVNKADLSGRIARWVLLLQEFDFTVEVRPGKHHDNADYLSRLPGEENEVRLDDDFPDEYIFYTRMEDSWYTDIIRLITQGILPKGLNLEQQTVFLHKAGPYTIYKGVLYKLAPDHTFKRCLEKNEISAVIESMHTEESGGHYALYNTVKKILNAGYWWPTMYRDTHTFIQTCDSCQRTGKPTASSHWPLTPIIPLAPFEKWGIDFIGPIDPVAAKSRARYIILATDYATKWVEAIATKKNDAMTAAKFIFEYIIVRFGCPLELVSDRGKHFLNKVIRYITDLYFIRHRKTTPYNPKANGLTERANGLMEKILLKIISAHKTDWDLKLHSALWAYRTAEKITTRQTPFYMVYGQHSIMPVEFEIPTQRVSIEERLPVEESQDARLLQLQKLEEDRMYALEETEKQQAKRSKKYNAKMKPVVIKEGDLVLMFDSRYMLFPGKFHTRWIGPFTAKKIYPNGSVQLEDMDGDELETRINGSRLKKYFLAPK